MSNIKELIRAEVKRLFKKYQESERWASKDCDNYNNEDIAFYQGKRKVCSEILSFLDTLPDEPVTTYDQLEEEISTWIPAHISGGDDEVWRDTKNAVTEWAGIVARHFAEWGADHLRDTTKKVPEDLEEAAETKYPTRWKKYPNDGIVRSEEYFDLNAEKRDAFKAGAEWQKEQDTREMIMSDGYFQKCYELGKKDMKEQMMEGAVDYKIVNNLAAYPVIYYEVNHLGLKYGDKVKLIIVKEEE